MEADGFKNKKRGNPFFITHLSIFSPISNAQINANI